MRVVATILLSACLWLLNGSASSVAAAQAPDADVQVQMSEARRHFDALDYEQAIPSADRAIALLQTRQGDAAVRTLAQALEIRARSHFGVSQPDAARQDFIALLKADPRYVLSSQVSPKVVVLFDEAKRSTVTKLNLTLEPRDATVLLDGTPVNASVNAGDVLVIVGRHTIEASRTGYQSQRKEFVAAPDLLSRETLSLVRSSAMLSVVTSPANVDVVVDGVSRGRTVAGTLPTEFASRAAAAGFTSADETGVMTLSNLTAGSHRIELRRACFVSVDRTQSINRLDDYVLDPVKLTAALASVTTSANQADAIVFVDGESRGRAPQTTQLCEGPHVVELRSPTGRYVQHVDAKAGQRIDVNGTLRPAFAVVSSTQTTLNADLRGAIERALQPLTSIMVFAPPAEALDAALRSEKLPPDWLAYDSNRRPVGVSTEVTASMRRDLSAKLSKAFDAQGIAAVTAPVANNRSRLVLTLLGAGISEPDVIEINLEQPDAVTSAVSKIDEGLTVLTSSIGASVIDVVDLPGPVVASVDANGPAAKAGIHVGDVVVSGNGQPVADSVALTGLISALGNGQLLSVQVQNMTGVRRALDVSVQQRPRVLGISDQTMLVNRTLVILRARLREATDPAEQASVRLNLAAALTRLESWTEARSELQQVTLTDGPGVGPGTVQYMLGLCNAGLGNRADAEAAFTAAAASSNLLTDDGPPVNELAQARLAELRRGSAR